MVRMMMLLTVLLGCFAAVTLSAPVEQFVSASVNAFPPRQILILNPEAQLQLKPALKLQAPIIQPLTAIGRIQNADDQTVIFYPAAPLNDLPLDQTDWLNKIFQLLQMWGQFPGLGGGKGDQDDMDSGKISPTSVLLPSPDTEKESGKIELNPEAETIPQGGQTPASTVPLPPNNRRFYTIGGAPQFFGNFDFLQNPVHPIFSLQPLEPIKTRSLSDLKNELATPLFNSKQKPVVLAPITAQPQVSESNSEYKPGVAAHRFAQFLVEQKVLHPENSPQIAERPGAAAQEFIQVLGQAQSVLPSSSKQGLNLDASESNESKESLPVRISEEASVAQAKPVAIAITGKGGLAQSAPIGTAIVGEDGYALSSPSATAIAGDFSQDSEEDKLKKQ